MKIVDRGAIVALADDDFIARGGEGAVYARGSTAYKIFDDPARACPQSKIDELAAIDDPRVCRPLRTVEDLRGTVIGHAMPRLQRVHSLTRLSTRSFADAEGFDPTRLLELIAALADCVRRIHDVGALVVDLSAHNVLVDALDVPHLIDVDSFQTPRHPATALTPSIACPLHTGGSFTPDQDWFAFAVVTFMVLTGIHPFKGKHPRVRAFAERLARRISVFDPEVRIPKACRGLGVLPPKLGDWYRAVFERDLRSPPPRDLGPHRPSIVPSNFAPTSCGSLHFELVREYDADIRAVSVRDGHILVATRASIHLDETRLGRCPESRVELGWTAGGRPFVARLAGSELRVGMSGEDETTTNLHLDEVTSTRDAALFGRRHGTLLRIDALDGGQHRPLLTTTLLARVPASASRMAPGVVLYHVLGRTHACLLGPRPRILRIPELDGMPIVDAAADGGVLVVLLARGTSLDRWIIRTSTAACGTSQYDILRQCDVPLDGANVLEIRRGLGGTRVGDRLQLFDPRPGQTFDLELPMDEPPQAFIAREGRVFAWRERHLYAIRWEVSDMVHRPGSGG